MSHTRSRSTTIIFGSILCVSAVVITAVLWRAHGRHHSGERKVLAYTAPAGASENRMTLRRRGDDLLLADDLTGDVLAACPLTDTSGVFIKGADGETNDTLTVDFSGGMFSPPEGIHYDGGVGGFDTLALAGGTATSERYDMKNANDGTITLDGLQIVFSNIEPVTDVAPAATFTVNGTAAGEQINIVDGPIFGGFQTTQVNSGASATFELVNFANKTDVTVNGLAGDDTFTLNVTTPAAGLSTLRVNGGGNTADIARVTNFTLSGGTLSLLGMKTITQIGGAIQTTNLAAQAGTVDLNNSNTVTNLAGTTSDFIQFGFSFTNSGNLNVGTVDGVVGVSGINNNPGAPFGDVVLSGGAGAVLTVSQPVTTPNGRIFFNFDDMAINNTVSGPTLGIFGPTIEGQVNLTPVTASRTIDLGTNSAGNLGLTDTELDHVNTSVLRLGNPPLATTFTGNVTETAPITQVGSGYTTMAIDTGGSVTNGGGIIVGTNLFINSGAGIGTSVAQFNTGGTLNLNFKNTGGVVNINTNGTLTIASVAGSGDSSNTGTTTTLSANAIAFSANTTSAGTLTLRASASAGNFLGQGGSVTSTGGGVVFGDFASTGHAWTIGPSSLAESPNAAIPYSTSTSLTVNGGSGNDTFNVTPSSTKPITIGGGAPATAPGDSLNVNTFGTTTPSLNITSSSGASKDGNYSFGNRQTVTFTSIETINTTGPITAQGTTLGATEGVPFTGTTVATFTSFDPSRSAGDFTATINWGDGTAFSTGTITGNGGFTVKGGHTYAEEGSYNISVTIHDGLNNFDATANTAATVADAPLSASAPSAGGSVVTVSGVGGNNTSVTAGTANAAMSAFKAAIGGADNGGTASPQANGFRTINWDGVALTATDGVFTNEVIVPNHVVGIPVNRFQARGVNFEEVYAVADDGFASVNPGAAGQFPAFSPTKTFAMFNDNTIDFSFVLPSAPSTPPIQSVSRGFGAIFLDVETPNTTSIEYFSGSTSLGKFFAPVGASGQPEFLGVLFQNAVVTNVHIELGTATLFNFDGATVTPGPGDSPPTTDLAVTDDFVYAEPTAIPTSANISASVGESVTARVASFTDQDPLGQLSDYTATINWGDSTTSAGTITPNATGGFDVTGTHTYFTAGTFTIITTINDIGGSSINIGASANVGGQSVLGSIQFSAPSASASESADSANINVTRTGDTSGPASVHFETSDGTARQKSDYTFGSGTVQFAPGETSKQISILLVNDVFVEGPETFFVTLSNPSDNFMVGSPSTAAITITDDDTAPPTANPIDAAQFFVRQHYLDFLGREADPSGLNFWTNQITSCGADANCIAVKRVNVSAAFFLSFEFQETSGFVIRTQRVAFGRQSSAATSRVPYLQFMRDTRQVGAGVVVGQAGFDTLLEANKQAYAQQMVNSPEFLARFPITPAAEYVDSLYASAAVTPTATERTAAINAFGAGGTAGRVAALRSVADSDSVRQAEFRSSFVLAEFFGYLRRNPTDAPDGNDNGYQFWLAKLNAFNGDFIAAEMVKAFINSSEYRQRFGP
jgi:Calx-beta domain/Domain of unknown function (DUF4214)